MHKTKTMTEATTSSLYDLWSWFYDYTFGALVHQRQIRAVKELRPKPGERILDLGCGTGMTLEYYPDDVEVVGMDLSAGMLDGAKAKIKAKGIKNVKLVRGDAMMPPFAEHSFDQVLVTHTITVVSEPEKLLAWAGRMVKPGGRIVVLNHFQSTNRVMAFLERISNPMWIKIGWKSDLPLAPLLKDSSFKVEYHFKMGILDLWQILVLSTPSAPSQPGPRTRVTRHAVPEWAASTIPDQLEVEAA